MEEVKSERTKVCNACKKELPISKFNFKNKEKGYYHANCKECSSRIDRERRQTDPEYAKRKNASSKKSAAKNPTKKREGTKKWIKEHPERYKELRKRYYDKHVDEILETKKERYDPELQRKKNIESKYGKRAFDYYQQKFKEQNGLCKICGNVSTNGLPLCLDHNHDTEQWRDLLCNHCNFLVGHSKEKISVLKKTIDYLEEWDTKDSLTNSNQKF